jgi:O-antigen/teichoic acid export membrane protein
VKASTKVVFNTSVLYAKLVIGVVIGLFTTRLVLDALGETDYGIFTLVAGVVGLLGILQSSMSSASMRFMAHSLGSDDSDIIRQTFNTTLFIHFVIGLIVIIIMEVGGLLMFEYLLSIPEARLWDAKIVFHFMVISTFVTIIAVPYDAVINSHENLLALSIIDVLGYLMRLGIAIYLTISPSNLLVLYGFLLLVTHITLRIIKQWYSRTKYMECVINFRTHVNKNLFKKILSFSGWNLFGSIAAISVTQARGILLNMFFGVSINAADGISNKASAQVNMISVSMTRALNPQLVKSEGSGNRQRMLRLTEIATKFSVFLFALFAIPGIIEASYLLNLWLTTVPEYAIIFFQLLLIGLLLEKFSFEITSALRATGRIKEFQVAETILILFNLPIAYLFFKRGYPPYTIFLISFFVTLLVFFSRLYFAKKIAGMDIKSFLKNGILPVLIPLLLATVIALTSKIYLSESFFRLIITTMSSAIVFLIIFWFYGLRKEETGIIKQILNTIIKKVRHK